MQTMRSECGMRSRRSGAARVAVLLLAWAIACAPACAPARAAEPAAFLGALVLPDRLPVADTVLGGLSGLTYVPAEDAFYAISDDRAAHGPARFYRLQVDVRDGHLAGLRILGAVPLRQPSGAPFGRGTVDPEAIAYDTARNRLLWSSEGIGARALPPRIFESALDGMPLGELPAPRLLREPSVGFGSTSGPRPNKDLEALAYAAADGTVWAGVEGPLRQDGDQGTGHSSAVRITALDRDGRERRQVAYLLDPLPAADADRGLVELAALEEGRLLALERSWSPSRGIFARVYLVETAAATDVRDMPALPADPAAGALRYATKRLLIDLDAQRMPLDNFEAMALGPALPDGRRLLLLASDDNFAAGRQRTIIAAFALDPAALR